MKTLKGDFFLNQVWKHGIKLYKFPWKGHVDAYLKKVKQLGQREQHYNFSVIYEWLIWTFEMDNLKVTLCILQLWGPEHKIKNNTQNALNLSLSIVLETLILHFLALKDYTMTVIAPLPWSYLQIPLQKANSVVLSFVITCFVQVAKVKTSTCTICANTIFEFGQKPKKMEI